MYYIYSVYIYCVYIYSVYMYVLYIYMYYIYMYHIYVYYIYMYYIYIHATIELHPQDQGVVQPSKRPKLEPKPAEAALFWFSMAANRYVKFTKKTWVYMTTYSYINGI